MLGKNYAGTLWAPYRCFKALHICTVATSYYGHARADALPTLGQAPSSGRPRLGGILPDSSEDLRRNAATRSQPRTQRPPIVSSRQRLAQPPEGMMKFDLHELGCDMYAGPFHKWMMASMYTGFFYVREELLERVEPIFTSSPPGKNMYGDLMTTPYLATAAKYERRGSSNTPARMAMDAALDYHNHLTPAAIEARDRYLAKRLRDGLRAINGTDVYVSDDPRMSCALVSFTLNGVATKDLNDMLWERHNIYIRSVTHKEVDWDVNRASMHIMVTAAQVDQLLGALEEIAKA